jgi:hypothetical protein
MARQDPPVQIKFSTTGKMKTFLEVLVAEGTYGKSVPEVVERIVAEKINALKGPGNLAEKLNRVA